MENQQRTWVIASFMTAALITALIVFALANKLAGTFDWEAKVRNIDLVIRLGSIALGAIIFFVLIAHQQVNQFMTEVVVELSRVAWPTQKETSSATLVVVIMVLISGVILGLLDYLWTAVMKWIL